MILTSERVVFVSGSQRTRQAIDLRSRRLKGFTIGDGWNAADLELCTSTSPPDDVVQPEVIYAEDGTAQVITGADNSSLYLIDPDALKGVDWFMLHASVSQGIPGGFAVIPNTTDFSVAPPVTFTVTSGDDTGVYGVSDVTLDADYGSVAGLATELLNQAPFVDTWFDNVGVLTCQFTGDLNAYVDVTNIVDPSDKMNFSSIIDFAFPGYATDVYVTLITEPRT